MKQNKFITSKIKSSIIQNRKNMSRTIVLKPQATKKLSSILKNTLSIEIEESKQLSYFEYVLRRLYKNYQQKMEVLYDEFLSYVEKWHIQWFVKSFQWRTKNVLLKVCHINFPNLKTLTLANLEIKNIEPIAWMDCPCLETLNLSNNEVNSLKPLSKLINKKLENIYLQNNKFSYQQVQNLQNRIHLNENKIQLFELGKNLKFSGYGIFCKLSTRKLEKQQFQFQLMTQKVKQQLRQKFISV